MTLKPSVICIGAVLSVACSGAAPLRAETKPDIGSLTTGRITVLATPVTSFNRVSGSETHFGKLEFRGGLVLTAPGAPNFGGWSGLAMEPDAKRFVAVSDAGVWMTGSISYDGIHPMALTDTRMGPLLSQDGNPLKRYRDRDAEAVA